MGSCDLVIYQAHVCLDQFVLVIELLGGSDGGSHQRALVLARVALNHIHGTDMVTHGGVSIRLASDASDFGGADTPRKV